MFYNDYMSEELPTSDVLGDILGSSGLLDCAVSEPKEDNNNVPFEVTNYCNDFCSLEGTFFGEMINWGQVENPQMSPSYTLSDIGVEHEKNGQIKENSVYIPSTSTDFDWTTNAPTFTTDSNYTNIDSQYTTDPVTLHPDISGRQQVGVNLMGSEVGQHQDQYSTNGFYYGTEVSPADTTFLDQTYSPVEPMYPLQNQPKRKYTKRGKNGESISATRRVRSLHYCHICSKGFKDKYSVNVHIRTHTGEKPYQCSFCTKCFRQKAHLAKHYQTHMEKRI